MGAPWNLTKAQVDALVKHHQQATPAGDEVKPRDGDSYDDARAEDLGLDTWDDEVGMSALEQLMFE